MTLPVPDPLWLAAAPGVVAVGIWAVVDLQRFILFAVLGTMIIPHALVRPGGTQVALADVLLLVALAAWLVAGSSRRAPAPSITSNRFLLPALLFVGVNAESLLWSVNQQQTIQFTIQILEIVVVFPLVFASLPRSTDVIRQGLIVFIGVTCVLAAIYIPNAAAGLPGGLGKNTVGSFLGAGLVMAYALLLAERRPAIRLLLALAALIEFAGLFASASRGSLIGAVVGVIVVTLLLRRGRVVTVIAVTLAAVSFLALNGTDSGADRSVQGSYDSATVRSYSVHHAIEKIKQEPLLGTGGGTYSDYISQLGINLPDPNNMLLLTWAELGVLGLLALGFLMYRFATLLVAVKNLPQSAAVLAAACGCTALSLVVHFQFDVTWSRGTASLMFAMIGLLVAIPRLATVAAHDRAPALSVPIMTPQRLARAGR